MSQVLPGPAGALVSGELVTDYVRPLECMFCGAHPHAGPEGAGWQLSNHCWRCGYQPGQEQVTATTAYSAQQSQVAAMVAAALSSPAAQAAVAMYQQIGAAGVEALMRQQQAG